LGEVCCFVVFNRYWGIVMYGPRALSWASQGRRTHDPRSPTSYPYPVPPLITWGVRILTLHLNYVAGYTDPILFLFERTYNYYVDNQGLVPWRLRRWPNKSQTRLFILIWAPRKHSAPDRNSRESDSSLMIMICQVSVNVLNLSVQTITVSKPESVVRQSEAFFVQPIVFRWVSVRTTSSLSSAGCYC